MALLAIAILAVLAGMIVPVVANRLDDLRMSGERASLAAMHREIVATFDATSFDLNEAALPDSGLPEGTSLTLFDAPSGLSAQIYSASRQAASDDWIARLAAKRGISLATSGASLSAVSGGEYGGLIFNPCGTQRCLLAGPTGEQGRQRYLLVSLMVPPFRLLGFPTEGSAELFNELWDQSWESVSVQAPAAWAGKLSASQFALWNAVSTGGRSNAARLLVERIVQPKYMVTVSNNSSTDTVWVDLGPAVDAIVAAPGSGVSSSASVTGFASGVLEGRLIVVRRGLAAAGAAEVQRFFLYSDVNLTIQ